MHNALMRQSGCINQPTKLLPPRRTLPLLLLLHWLRISSPWRGSTSVPLLGKRRVFVIKWSPASAQAHSGGKLLDRSMQVISNPIRVTFRKLDLLETEPAEYSNMSDISNSRTKWKIWCCESKFSWHRSFVENMKVRVYPHNMWGYHGAAMLARGWKQTYLVENYLLRKGGGGPFEWSENYFLRTNK